jgi:hypothetical protein
MPKFRMFLSTEAPMFQEQQKCIIPVILSCLFHAPFVVLNL